MPLRAAQIGLALHCNFNPRRVHSVRPLPLGPPLQKLGKNLQLCPSNGVKPISHIHFTAVLTHTDLPADELCQCHLHGLLILYPVKRGAPEHRGCTLNLRRARVPGKIANRFGPQRFRGL